MSEVSSVKNCKIPSIGFSFDFSIFPEKSRKHISGDKTDIK